MTMSVQDAVRAMAGDILAGGTADGVLGLQASPGRVAAPCVFTDPAETAALVLEPKWLLAKTAMRLLREAPGGYRLAFVCRGCDERAVLELAKRNQLPGGRLRIVGYPCSAAQAKACGCARPFPAAPVAGTPAAGVDPLREAPASTLLAGAPEERRRRWRIHLDRCLKCFGCRNACPMCVCVPCKLEDDLWVSRGTIPADAVSYHLIRAWHLADSCIACGACQEACPAQIPLLALQLSMRETLRAAYGYEAGMDGQRKSPIHADLVREPAAGVTLPDWIDDGRRADGV